MNLSFPWRVVVSLTESQSMELCQWNYPSPYDIYNWPTWEHMLHEDMEFADPQIRSAQYGAVVDEMKQLCGFVQFFPIIGVTRLGLGLHPELCGKGNGIGVSLVKLLVQEAQRRSPLNEIDLEVLVWNERAIHTYQHAGFIITDTYDKMTPSGLAAFHCMVYNEEADQANS